MSGALRSARLNMEQQLAAERALLRAEMERQLEEEFGALRQQLRLRSLRAAHSEAKAAWKADKQNAVLQARWTAAVQKLSAAEQADQSADWRRGM